jgi:hypothetical protein
MKNLIFLFVLASTTFFTACESEPKTIYLYSRLDFSEVKKSFLESRDTSMLLLLDSSNFRNDTVMVSGQKKITIRYERLREKLNLSKPEEKYWSERSALQQKILDWILEFHLKSSSEIMQKDWIAFRELLTASEKEALKEEATIRKYNSLVEKSFLGMIDNEEKNTTEFLSRF